MPRELDKPAGRTVAMTVSDGTRIFVTETEGHTYETTQTYLHAHLELKEAALAKLKPYQGNTRTRFRPDDRLLAFLEAL